MIVDLSNTIEIKTYESGDRGYSDLPVLLRFVKIPCIKDILTGL